MKTLDAEHFTQRNYFAIGLQCFKLTCGKYEKTARLTFYIFLAETYKIKRLILLFFLLLKLFSFQYIHSWDSNIKSITVSRTPFLKFCARISILALIANHHAKNLFKFYGIRPVYQAFTA